MIQFLKLQVGSPQRTHNDNDAMMTSSLRQNVVVIVSMAKKIGIVVVDVPRPSSTMVFIML